MLKEYTPKQKLAIYLITGVFLLIFCSISLVNHYFFRTSAYDLGIYNNMMYSYSHLKFNYTSIQQPLIPHAFADHFEPIFFLFSPFYWLFGTYTLLVIQIVFIVAGGLGAMRYVQLFTKNNSLSIASLFHFYSIWGIYSALCFDFHNNVTAAMMVPWLMVFVHQQKWKQSLIFFILMLMSKENMALFTVFVCLGLALHYFRTPEIRKKMFLFSGLAAVYFVLIVKVVIPSFHPPDMGYVYEGMYRALGETPGDMLKNLLTKPGDIFGLLFEHPGFEPFYDGIKSELHFSVLISGGVFMIYRPQFLVMLIPIYAQKLFVNDPTKWGINNHYSIEFVPVIAITTAIFLSTVTHKGIRRYFPYAMALLTLLYTISKLESRKSIWYDKINSRFYQKAHYESSFDVNIMKDYLKEYKDLEAVSAQSVLVPRLADRDSIYMYPTATHARHIFLAPGTATYPLKDSAYQANLDTLMHSKHWQLVQDKKILLYFRKTDQ